jgi:PPP family 3-phenylpropionic acid transporter
MDGDAGERDKHLEVRFAIAYALLFAAVAPMVGYLNLYLQRRGLSDSQIGTTAAIMSLFSILSPPLWGYLSDRWHDRRLPLAVASLGAAIVFLAYFFASFPIVLLVAALFAFFHSPLIPLLDALVLERLGEGRERYGRIRAWGSWAFIAMMLIFGLTLKKQGTAESLIPALSTFVILRVAFAISAAFLPRNGAGKPMGDGDWKAVKELFANRDWQAFLAISLLSMVSTSVFYAFFPLYLNRAGVSDNWQGYFWVIAVLAEVAFMTWLTEPLIKRIGLKGVFLLGVAGRAFRFAAYAFPLSFPTLLALQTLHSLTFAAVHTASVTWVSVKAPERARALTQTLYASVLMGIGSAIGAQIGGIIAEHFGLRFLFGLAGAINGLAFLLGLLWLKEPSLQPEEVSSSQSKQLATTCDRKGGCAK